MKTAETTVNHGPAHVPLDLSNAVWSTAYEHTQSHKIADAVLVALIREWPAALAEVSAPAAAVRSTKRNGLVKVDSAPADARLIAAAPEMLALLHETVGELHSTTNLRVRALLASLSASPASAPEAPNRRQA